jgi:hypothetical protein
MNEPVFNNRTKRSALNGAPLAESAQPLAPSPHSSPVKGEKLGILKSEMADPKLGLSPSAVLRINSVEVSEI